MVVLEAIATFAYLAWGLYTFWIVFQILKLCWPVLKGDWFWFATKSNYYKGFLLSFAWCLIAMAPEAWLGQTWILVPLVIQIGIAVKMTHNKPIPKLDRAIWFGIPFFMFPLWLTVRQGQRLGEIPRAA